MRSPDRRSNRSFEDTFAMPTPRITDDMLLAYAAGELRDADAAAVEAKLAISAEARQLVELYRTVRATIAEDDQVEPEPALIARAKAIFKEQREPAGMAAAAAKVSDWWRRLESAVAEIVFDSRVQPSLAGLRSGDDPGGGFQLACETSRAVVDLQFQPQGAVGVAADRQPWRLIGQIAPTESTSSSDDQHGASTPRITEVAVFTAGTDDEPVATIRPDAHGVFTTSLDPGRYEVRIALDDEQIVLRAIEIP
jgi:hypothetical protein